MVRPPILLVCVFLLLASFFSPSLARPDSYRAAAVQFTPSGAVNDPPLQVIQQSVDRFESFVQEAQKQEVQVMVFPEGALGMFNAGS